MKMLKATSTILFCLLILSCSKSKNPLQLEAEQQSEQWFAKSVAKCDDNFVVKYDGVDITVARSLSVMKKVYFQFKDLSYAVAEIPVTEADKLNGIEWQGFFALQPVEPNLRYYDVSYSTSGKWSDWQKGLVPYMDKFTTYQNNSKNIPNTPFVMLIRKVKGKWEGFSDELTKPQCAEVPNG